MLAIYGISYVLFCECLLLLGSQFIHFLLSVAARSCYIYTKSIELCKTGTFSCGYWALINCTKCDY